MIVETFRSLKKRLPSIFILLNRRSKAKLLIIVVIIIFTVIFFAFFNGNSDRSDTLRVADKREGVAGAKASQTVNKTFTFPLKDAQNVEVGKFKYIITKVQLQDEIIVKGQRATAVKGRTFLIVDLKIENNSSHIFNINTRDYIRLSIKGEKERFAADIHNDPVQIQAISTKLTRLGFPINDTNKKFELFVGEIKGEKKSISINL